MERPGALKRVVAQQTLMRDRALARSSALDRQMRALADKEQALRAPSSAGPEMDDILLPLVARRLAAIERERASLTALRKDAEADARNHARLARAGEARVARARATIEEAQERARLEAMVFPAPARGKGIGIASNAQGQVDPADIREFACR